jgi:hypothetical protein
MWGCRFNDPVQRVMTSSFIRVGRSVTGLGLFATKPIKRGGYIVTYRGRRISTGEAEQREARGARRRHRKASRSLIILPGPL